MEIRNYSLASLPQLPERLLSLDLSNLSGSRSLTTLGNLPTSLDGLILSQQAYAAAANAWSLASQQQSAPSVLQAEVAARFEANAPDTNTVTRINWAIFANRETLSTSGLDSCQYEKIFMDNQRDFVTLDDFVNPDDETEWCLLRRDDAFDIVKATTAKTLLCEGYVNPHTRRPLDETKDIVRGEEMLLHFPL